MDALCDDIQRLIAEKKVGLDETTVMIYRQIGPVRRLYYVLKRNTNDLPNHVLFYETTCRCNECSGKLTKPLYLKRKRALELIMERDIVGVWDSTFFVVVAHEAIAIEAIPYEITSSTIKSSIIRQYYNMVFLTDYPTNCFENEKEAEDKDIDSFEDLSEERSKVYVDKTMANNKKTFHEMMELIEELCLIA